MKNKDFKLSLAGFAFVGIFGSICHFLYEFFGYSRIAGIFFPVNESVWEHLKMLFLPYLIWGITEALICREYSKRWFAKATGAAGGMIFITSFYYTSLGIIGKSNEYLNIFSFLAGIFIAFLIENKLIKSSKLNCEALNTAGIIIFVITALLFTVFTFAPPLTELFRSPDNNTFGI